MSDLLPPNALPGERALSLATARLGEVTTPVRTLHDPDTCPAALLPWLAWALSVDEWNADWTESQKRGAIRASIFVHKHKGTIGALRAAIDALGMAVEVVEWFQEDPAASPHTFRGVITVDQEPVGAAPESFDLIVRVAESAKNLRSHMTGVDIRAFSSGTEYVAAAAYLGETVTIAAEPA